MANYWLHFCAPDEWRDVRKAGETATFTWRNPAAAAMHTGDVLIVCQAGTNTVHAVWHVTTCCHVMSAYKEPQQYTATCRLAFCAHGGGCAAPELEVYQHLHYPAKWSPCRVAAEAGLALCARVQADANTVPRAATVLTHEHVRWAYRLLLDREPENEDIVRRKLATWATTRELRTDLLQSHEYHQRNPDAAAAPSQLLVIKTLPCGARLWLDLSDRVIGIEMLHDRYEPNETAFVERMLAPGDCAIDLGANLGYFTMIMAQRVGAHGHVYAFEPVPRNADLLERSRAENKFEDRITVTRAAVAECAGTVQMLVPLHTINWGGPYIDAREELPPEHEHITVPAVRLDDVVARHPVRFIKMDIEGAELLALRGAEQLLRRDRPVVMCECNPPQLQNVSHASPQDLIDWMTALNYGVHVLSGSTLMAADPAALGGSISTLVCVPH